MECCTACHTPFLILKYQCRFYLSNPSSQHLALFVSSESRINESTDSPKTYFVYYLTSPTQQVSCSGFSCSNSCFPLSRKARFTSFAPSTKHYHCCQKHCLFLQELRRFHWLALFLLARDWLDFIE